MQNYSKKAARILDCPFNFHKAAGQTDMPACPFSRCRGRLDFIFDISASAQSS